jgi:hypothetical protein
MSKAPRFTVSLDRLDGGEPIEERKVDDVQLNRGNVTILDGKTRVFSGDGWSWLEVRRIDEAADVSLIVKMPARRTAVARPTRQTRSSKSSGR